MKIRDRVQREDKCSVLEAYRAADREVQAARAQKAQAFSEPATSAAAGSIDTSSSDADGLVSSAAAAGSSDTAAGSRDAGGEGAEQAAEQSEAPAKPAKKRAAGAIAADADAELAEDEAQDQVKSAWAKLKKAARGRTASKHVVQDWVADHIHDEPGEIDPAGVPSPGAVPFLIWAKENTNLFYKEMYGKAGVRKDAQQKDPRLTEDGRSIPDMLDEFKRLRREHERSVVLAGS